MSKFKREKPLYVGILLLFSLSNFFSLLLLKSVSFSSLKLGLMISVGPFSGIITSLKGVKEPFVWFTGIPLILVMSLFFIKPNKTTLVSYYLSILLWLLWGVIFASISL